MSLLFCVTSSAPVGCTFVEWSINYLSGLPHYLQWNGDTVPLVDNPLSNNNAHKHPRNHPAGLADSVACVTALRSYNQLASFFPFMPSVMDVCARLNVDVSDIRNKDTFSLVRLERDNEYNKMLKEFHRLGVRVVYINPNRTIPLYYDNDRKSLSRYFASNTKPESAEDARDFTHRLFFKEDMLRQQSLGITDSTWDRREILALRTRPLEPYFTDVDLSIPHYWVDCLDLWQRGPTVLLEVMQWLGLVTDESRYDHWLDIFRKWQSMQFNFLKFQWQYEHIIESIIKGNDYRIDLNFNEEVVIQHCLIYQHNLNLKTWNLIKFPDNTKDLHQLLEPNIHKLE